MKTILVAEDNALVRRTYCHFLEGKGYNVLAAEDGTQALSLFHKHDPDLLLTDLRMPKMDGMDLIREVARLSPQTPIIIFSGLGTIVDVIEALRIGAWDYLTKPISKMEILEHSIQKALERVNLLRRDEQYQIELEQEIARQTKQLQNQNRQLQQEIQERLEVERKKEKIQSQLLHAQKLEAVGRLAAGIAHEINTPIQFIGANLEFLAAAMADLDTFMEKITAISQSAPKTCATAIKQAKEEMDWHFLNEELPQAIDQSLDGIERITSIVQAMKEFSHPGTRKKEPHDINKIITTTVTVARNEWKYVAEVHLDLDPNLPHVQCLPHEIGQVILNLLVNGAHAIQAKYNDNSEETKGTIHIKTRMGSHGVEIEIKDDGIGIAKEVQHKIFDPFFTTKEIGKGTGQGLAIAHDVIYTKHEGRLIFESQVGKGTTFLINLPTQCP